MRVLLIEDDPQTAKAVELLLAKDGSHCDRTDLGQEGLELSTLEDYDVILLDLNLPDMHGYDVLKKLRLSNVQTPIVILSGLADIGAKVRTLGLGADDYVTKPFYGEELVARIFAVVRRANGYDEAVINIGKIAVHVAANAVEVDGIRVHLTCNEYAMLELMALRRDTLVTKDMFMSHLYSGMDEPTLKIVDVFICKLRKKLSRAGAGGNCVETVWGNGYVLRDPKVAGIALAA